ALAACRDREVRSHARDGEADGIRRTDREFPGRVSGSRPPMSAARDAADSDISSKLARTLLVAPRVGRSDRWLCSNAQQWARANAIDPEGTSDPRSVKVGHGGETGQIRFLRQIVD